MKDNKVYEIREFDLICKRLFTYKEREDLTLFERGKEDIFIDDNGNKWKGDQRLYSLVVGLDKLPKERLFSADEKHLPYFADVTEDLPGWVKFEPTTWKGCQLLSEKHGGYLQFHHKESDKVLRIAMNSNIYKPCDF